MRQISTYACFALSALRQRGGRVAGRSNSGRAVAICMATMALVGLSVDARAAILLDQSPATTGAAILSDGLDNRSISQNFAEDFSFGTAVSLTGMDIYMAEDVATVGQSVTIRLYEDASGIPGTKLSDFTETVSTIDLIGAVGTNERVHADFTIPLLLEADTTYWIGMSGTGVTTFSLTGLGDVVDAPYDDRTMAQFTAESFSFISGTGTGDMAFRLEGIIVPEPTSAALMALGCLALLYLRTRR
mgnify:CR=1 FL=1